MERINPIFTEAWNIASFCWKYKWDIVKFKLVTNECKDCRSGYCSDHMKWLNDIISYYYNE